MWLCLYFVAIVLRCLQAVMLLIQDVKTYFRKRLTPKKCVLLLQFDQVNEVSDRMFIIPDGIVRYRMTYVYTYAHVHVHMSI